MRLLLLAAFLLGSSVLNAQQPAPDAALQHQLEAIAAAHAGEVALYAENLRTHQTVTLQPDLVVQTASVIKLGILYEALEQLRAGKVHWDDRVVIAKADQVPGSGILHLLDTPMTITFKDSLTLMIALSDNEATNLAIDHLGLTAIDARMASLGLTHTYLYKKVFTPVTPGQVLPADFKQYGLGKTTPREMAELMTKIVRCELGGTTSAADHALCATAVDMLHVQFSRGGIPRYLDAMPGATGTSIANKTGALDAVRNDVAVVSTPEGLVVIAAFTFNNKDRAWVVDHPAELTIAKLARAVIAAWSPEGLASWPASAR